MKYLSPQEFRHMPWKNGAGTTIEIAVFPHGAGLDEFVWRVSRAKVVADGGFSHFAGIDRSLALLNGVGMRMQIDAGSQQVDTENNIAVFPGDAAIHAELLDGPIEDFNLMSRRSVCRHRLSHWVGAKEQPLPENTVLLYCAQGSGTLSANQDKLVLQNDSAVLIEEGDLNNQVVLTSLPDSRFYCVQIQTL